jgi:DNA-binding NarL/FixJ family response regulator
MASGNDMARPARRALPDEAWSAAARAGRAMSLPLAIAEALQPPPSSVEQPAEGQRAHEAPAPGFTASLAPQAIAPASTPGPTTAPAHSGVTARGAVPTPLRPMPVGLSGALTRRELEVAALVARGLTNRQIAAELVITEGTAANHVKHILARLGVDSRVQVAAWAVEHGLYRSSATPGSVSA